MNRAPSFQFYPDKWQSHTRRLSDQSYRVYHELLCWMWQSSEDYCSVQNSPEAIACAIAMQTECVRIALAEIQNPFSPLLKEENGRLVSNGLKKARQAQLDKSHKAKEAANARWKDANAMQTHKPSIAEKPNPQCIPTPTPTPTLTPSINTSTPQTPPAKPRRPVDDTPEFLRFWNVYPRKVGKPNAARAFAKALRNATIDDIMRGLAAHLPAWAESDPQFTPHPATWLNRQGWNDSPLQKTLPKPTGNYSQTGYRQPQAKPVVTETDRFVRQQIEDGILRVTADGKIEAVPIEELSKTKP